MLHEHCMILAETLSDPTRACLRDSPGPVSTALGWVKALSLVIGVVALVRIGVHILRRATACQTATTRSTSSSTG